MIEARGLPPTQGYWDAALLLRGDGPVDGTLTYDLLVAPPPGPRRVGTPASREVVVGAAVSAPVLRDVRRIRVEGRLGAREVGR